MSNIFHLAFPVNDLEAAREFYGGVLECEEGRSSERWIDFNLYGHQIVAHLTEKGAGVKASNHVDADDVPVPHFGIVLPMDEWHELAEQLKAFVKSHLAVYKYPRWIEFVSSLPKNDRGKIDRRKLKQS